MEVRNPKTIQIKKNHIYIYTYKYVFSEIVTNTYIKNSSRAYLDCESLQMRTTMHEEFYSIKFVCMHRSLHYQVLYAEGKTHPERFFSAGNNLKIVKTEPIVILK